MKIRLHYFLPVEIITLWQRCCFWLLCMLGLALASSVHAQDADNDRIPNAWELEHFGSTTGADPEANEDGDLLNNLEEYQAGLDPNVVDSFTVRVTPSEGGNLLEWDTQDGRLYNIFCSADLASGFELLKPNVLGGSMMDTEHAGESSMFYYATARPEGLDTYEIAAYLPYWGFPAYQDYHYEYLTTLYIIGEIARDSVMEDEGITWGNQPEPDFDEMLGYIRSVNPNIKIILSIADLHNNNTQRAESATLFTNANRATTIAWLMDNYVDPYDFDGVDIDIEDDSLNSNYVGANYPLLIRDLAIALRDEEARGRRKLIISTLNPNDYTRGLIMTPDLINNVDLMQVMDYGSDKIDVVFTNPFRNMKASAAAWSNLFPKHKLSLGIAGWSVYATQSGAFAEGFAYNWKDQLELRPGARRFIPYITTDYYTPNRAASWQQRYNSLPEIQRKAEWTQDNGYRGLFMWDLSKDPTKPDYEEFGYLRRLHEWREHPGMHPKIVAYMRNDYYTTATPITVNYHSMAPSSNIWAGVYDFTSGESKGFLRYVNSSGTGSFNVPVSMLNQLDANGLYEIRFYEGADQAEETLLGVSHPFYRL